MGRLVQFARAAAFARYIVTLPIGAAADPATAPGRETLEQFIPHTADCGGQPCDAVQGGIRTFLNRGLNGLGANGRSCADCHVPADRFQLTPAQAEARFQALQQRRQYDPSADDPLFRPIDADDFRVNGVNATDFSNLRQNGLIRITFPLPANIRLIDPQTGMPSNETFVEVWRSVPSVLNVALTGPDGQKPWPRGPNPTGGYQLDARFGSLQEQALGAFLNHAQVQRMPPQQMLDQLNSLQSVMFSGERVRALADAIRNGTFPLPDTDPPLNDLEAQGKAVFTRACAHCHGGPGQSTTHDPVRFRYSSISAQCPRPMDTVTPARFQFAPCPASLERNARTYEITLPDGSKIRRTSSDPGRALLTGFVGGPPPADDWEKLDVPGLHGIAYTAPYFHNNSAATLRDVVDHYIELFKSIKAETPPGAPPPPVASTDGIHFDRQPLPEERDALVAYLKTL